MTTFETQVTETIQRTHNVLSVRLARLDGMDFEAGQFMQVTLVRAAEPRQGQSSPQVGSDSRTLAVDGTEESKFLSVSNSPTEKGYVEFTKKLTGSKFSEALKRLKPGDRLKIKMPMGVFTLNQSAGKYAFLAGGIGITPIRSIWKDVSDRELPLDLILLYGNRTPEDIVFRSDFETMQSAYKNLKVVFSLDTADACPRDWKGRCGFISADMIREEVPDFPERIFYVCGPPAMVKIMSGILTAELQIPSSHLRQENFTGY